MKYDGLPIDKCSPKRVVMTDERAICHEAGHAIVGLHFGFNIADICVSGMPQIRWSLPAEQPDSACCAVAAGVAAEQITFGRHCEDAAGSDRQQIKDRSGKSLESYLAEAKNILQKYLSCFCEMRKEMLKNWMQEDAANSLEAGAPLAPSLILSAPSFTILGHDEMLAIWKSHSGV